MVEVVKSAKINYMKTIEHIKNTFAAKEPYPTAITCLLSIVNYFKGSIEPKFLITSSKTFEGVTKLSHLSNTANAVGFETKSVRSNLENLRTINKPVILFIENDQCQKDYIVCYDYYDNRFLVGVPGLGITQYTDEEMTAIWEGIMLYLTVSDNFVLKKDYENKRLQWVLSKFSNTWIAFVFYIVFAIFSITLFLLAVKILPVINLQSIICSLFSFLFFIASISFKQYAEKTFAIAISKTIENNDVSLVPVEKIDGFLYTVNLVEYALIVIVSVILYQENLPLSIQISIFILASWALLRIWESFLIIKSSIKALLQLFDFCTR